jgi:hypothetical protein
VLSMIIASLHRGHKFDPGKNGDFDLYQAMPLVLGSGSPGDRFVLDSWTVKWDSGKKVFSRNKRTQVIKAYQGTSKISKLDFFPLRYYGKDQNERDELLSRMRDRGLIWREWITNRGSCRQYHGPAKEMAYDLFGAREKEQTNVRKSTCCVEIVTILCALRN